MQTLTTRYPVMADEPHLGYQTEVQLMADGYELVEQFIELYMDEGEVPTLLVLQDQNDEDHEIAVDFITKADQCALETLVEYWPEDDWEEARTIVEALMPQNKSWLRTTHELEAI